MATYKVIGVGEHKKYFDENSYHSVINYIFSHAVSIGGSTHSAETAADEMLYIANYFGKNNGKRLRHSMLSFSKEEGVTAALANNYALGIKEFYADEYQIVYAVHANTDEVHVHFVMNQISFIDGHRYAGKKQDYYAFIRYIRRIIEAGKLHQNKYPVPAAGAGCLPHVHRKPENRLFAGRCEIWQQAG